MLLINWQVVINIFLRSLSAESITIHLETPTNFYTPSYISFFKLIHTHPCSHSLVVTEMHPHQAATFLLLDFRLFHRLFIVTHTHPTVGDTWWSYRQAGNSVREMFVSAHRKVCFLIFLKTFHPTKNVSMYMYKLVLWIILLSFEIINIYAYICMYIHTYKGV